MDAFKKILPLHWNKKRFDKEKIKLETLQETKEYQHVKKFFLLKHTNYTVTQIQRVENCFDYLAYFIEREKYILKTDLMPLEDVVIIKTCSACLNIRLETNNDSRLNCACKTTTTCDTFLYVRKCSVGINISSNCYVEYVIHAASKTV